MSVEKRVRRSAEASKLAILEAAERRLAAEGPDGVKIQRIAAELGIRDATVHYHFGDREGLMAALLRFSGRRFREDVEASIAALGPGAQFDAARVASLFVDLYETRGAARLVLYLLAAGWTPEGEGLFRPLAQALHAAREAAAAADAPPPSLEDSQRMVALLADLAFAQAIAKGAHLRAVGLDPRRSGDLAAWVARLEPAG